MSNKKSSGWDFRGFVGDEILPSYISKLVYLHGYDLVPNLQCQRFFELDNQIADFLMDVGLVFGSKTDFILVATFGVKGEF